MHPEQEESFEVLEGTDEVPPRPAHDRRPGGRDRGRAGRPRAQVHQQRRRRGTRPRPGHPGAGHGGPARHDLRARPRGQGRALGHAQAAAPRTVREPLPARGPRAVPAGAAGARADGAAGRDRAPARPQRPLRAAAGLRARLVRHAQHAAAREARLAGRDDVAAQLLELGELGVDPVRARRPVASARIRRCAAGVVRGERVDDVAQPESDRLELAHEPIRPTVRARSRGSRRRPRGPGSTPTRS